MKKSKSKPVCINFCINCFHFLQIENDDFNGFCVFEWPPYIEPKKQPVGAYDSCSLFDEFEVESIEFVEEE